MEINDVIQDYLGDMDEALGTGILKIGGSMESLRQAKK